MVFQNKLVIVVVMVLYLGGIVNGVDYEDWFEEFFDW